MNATIKKNIARKTVDTIVMTTKEKGDQYEIFVRDHILHKLKKSAWLWPDIPEQQLIEAGLIHSNNEARLKRKEKLTKENPLLDTGVDILQQDADGFTLVQCKMATTTVSL